MVLFANVQRISLMEATSTHFWIWGEKKKPKYIVCNEFELSFPRRESEIMWSIRRKLREFFVSRPQNTGIRLCARRITCIREIRAEGMRSGYGILPAVIALQHTSVLELEAKNADDMWACIPSILFCIINAWIGEMYEIDRKRRAQQIPFEELRLHFLYVATGSYISTMFLFLFTFCYSASRFRRTNGQVWFCKCFRVERGNCVCDVIWMTICRRWTVNVRRCVLDSHFDTQEFMIIYFLRSNSRRRNHYFWSDSEQRCAHTSGFELSSKNVRLRFYGFTWWWWKHLCVIFCCLFRSLQRDKSIWAHQVPYYYVIWIERIARMLTHSAFTRMSSDAEMGSTKQNNLPTAAERLCIHTRKEVADCLVLLQHTTHTPVLFNIFFILYFGFFFQHFSSPAFSCRDIWKLLFLSFASTPGLCLPLDRIHSRSPSQYLFLALLVSLLACLFLFDKLYAHNLSWRTAHITSSMQHVV